MRRIIFATLVCLLSLTGVANARVRFVAASGGKADSLYGVCAGNANLTYATAHPESCMTLSMAKSKARPGDIFYLTAGTYGSLGDSMNAGTGALAATAIQFKGDSTFADSAVVQGVSAKSYVHIRGMKFSVSSFQLTNTSFDCVSAQTTLTDGVGIFDCRITIVANNSALVFTGLRYANVQRNKFRVYQNGEHGQAKFYGLNTCNFYDNSFYLYNNTNASDGYGDESGTIYIRDRSLYVQFLRDTFDLVGPQKNQFKLTASGQSGCETANRHNSYRYCIFRNNQATWLGVPLLNWQAHCYGDTMDHCVAIATDSYVLGPDAQDTPGPQGGTVITNNTFIRLGSSLGEVAKFDTEHMDSTIVVHSNIFYRQSSGVVLNVSGGPSYRHWRSNWNLFYSKNAGSGQVYYINNTYNPGNATLCSNYQMECQSLAGDPMFVGGTMATDFDWTLGFGSKARGADSLSADMGAKAYAAAASAYYVNQAIGNDNFTGTAATFTSPNVGPWASLAPANTYMRSGLKCYIYPGNYSVSINPDSAGNSPGFITFLGTATAPISDTTIRKTIILPATTLSKPYVVVKGVTFAGDLSLTEAADFDTIKACNILGSLDVDADYALVDTCAIDGPRFTVGSGSTADVVSGAKVAHNSFRKLGSGYQGRGLPLVEVLNSDSLSLHFNRFNATLEPILLNPDSPVPVWRLDSLAVRTSSRGNNTLIYDLRQHDGTYSGGNYFVRGGGSSRNTADLDSLRVVAPTAGGDWLLSAVWVASDTSGASSADSCLIDLAACERQSRVLFDNGMVTSSLTYTTIATHGPAIVAHQLAGRNTINHCTLVGDVSNVAPGGANAVLDFTNPGSKPAWGDTALTLTNCIITSLSNPGTVTDTTTGLVAFADGVVDSASNSVKRGTLVVDRADKGQKKLLSGNNLYWFQPYVANRADLCWTNYDAPSSRKTTAWKPGQAAPSASYWNTDSLSKFGSPCFFDSVTDVSRGRTFNPRIRGMSLAKSIGTSSTDAGAVAYTNAPQITIRDGSGNLYNSCETGNCPPTPTNATLVLNTANAGNDTVYVDVTNASGNISVSLLAPLASDALGQQLKFFVTTYPTLQPKGVFTPGDQGDQLSVGTFRYFFTLKSGSTLKGTKSLLFYVNSDYGTQRYTVPIKYQ